MSWQLASLLVLVAALAAGFGWYERERPSARVLALVAAMAALAVVGRLAFAAIPNVKPTTDIVLFAGYALGAVPGFAVGAVTAVVSNVFLSQGPWTAWQMAGWGGVGIGGALLAWLVRGRELGRWSLAAVCALAGLAFGAWMDVYQWTLAARQDLDSYIAIAGTSLPYNLAHVIGNVVFCLLIGPVFIRALRRYRRRFQVEWEAPAVKPAVAALLLAAVVVGGSVGEAKASAASSAARYLRGSQNEDGGFGGARGQSSNQLHTGWSALGLAAAKRNPRDVHRRGGRAITTFLRKHADSLTDVGEVERTILVLRTAGLSPRKFGGRNLVAELLGRRRADGSYGGYVSYTAFGILALRAAREPVGRTSVRWLVRSQADGGGFGLTPSSAPDSDMTGAALQALKVGGYAGGRTAARAVGFLRRAQNGDGGFGQFPGRSSNVQSTAYAVQGLVAVGADPDVVTRAVGYIKSLQRDDGSITYSRTSSQTPVWVTAQALLALKRKPLPIKKVKRKRRRSSASVTAVAARKGGGGKRSTRSTDKDAGEAGGATQPSIGVPAGTTRDSTSTATRVAPDDDRPAAWLLAPALAITLVLLWLLRRWLRARRPAVP